MNILSASAESLAHADNGFIQVVSGKFWLARPHFDLRDIFQSLPTKPRFSGFCRPTYTTAAHSVMVSKIMEAYGWGDPFEGLMHDATEAYLPDIPSPWKRMLPDFKRLEEKIETPLRAHFCLPAVKTFECSHADWLALYIEAEQILPGGSKDFTNPYGYREEALEIIDDWNLTTFDEARARVEFEQRFRQLRGFSYDR